MRKIAIISSKGGTGKTTTAINLSHALSLKGENVILVDTDPQDTISVMFNLSPKETLNDLLIRKRTSITKVREKLHVITSGGLSLVDTSIKMAKRFKKEFILKSSMTGLDNVDYVVIDSGASLNLININVLTYVDEVIIPVGMDFLSQVGAKQAIDMIYKVRDLYNPDLKICGILPFFFKEGDQASEETIGILKEHFPRELLKSYIHYDKNLIESPGFVKTIFEYNPDSKGAADFMSLAAEIDKKRNG
ncbi:MAG: ParA family protein [Candidatus Delongbacteria bacterium]|nr:ParA family protein [Candidatus Delongbacteria bacterium]MBN2834661.1 ParA family protein [Candidatus Delongbacteria bacterium]